MASRRAVVWCVAAILSIVACGSSSEDGLFGGKGGSGGVDASVGGSAGASGGGTSGGSGGAAGSSGAAGSGHEDSGIGGVAGVGGLSDAGEGDAKPDATGGATGIGTGKCGDKICAFVAEDYCCKPNNAAPYCANETVGNDCECSGAFCFTIDIHCDGAEDCGGGEVCCADTGFTGGDYNVVECRSTCETPTIGGPQYVVCHLGNPECPKGTCQPDAGLPAGYGTCK
jgi:hypothetical protein